MPVHKHITSKKALQILERIKKICARLPGIEQVTDGHGHETFKVKNKSIIMMGENENGFGISLKADLNMQAALIEKGPYTRARYIGQHGWVSLTANDKLDYKEIEMIIVEAYRANAPKKLVKQLE